MLAGGSDNKVDVEEAALTARWQLVRYEVSGCGIPGVWEGIQQGIEDR